jgi:beta-lactamase class A
MMKRLTGTFAVVALLLFGQPSQAEPNEALIRHLEAITSPLVGRVGVAAQLIGGSDVIAVNGTETFPMASTYKIPAAVAVLRKIEAGELTLDRMVELKPGDIAAGDNLIALNFVHPGIQLSVANLIEVMITLSDNSATDKVFELAGGPAAITASMRKLAITGMRIDRNTKDLMTDMLDMKVPGTAAAVAEFVRKNPAAAAKFATLSKDVAYEADPRDQSTPIAMLDLLMQIDAAKATEGTSRAFLLASMSRTNTGAGRIKALLPRGTAVAHKTGTSGGVANDVGYVSLPDGRRFAIVVFTKSSDTPPADRDRAVAEVARTLYDYFSTHEQ